MEQTQSPLSPIAEQVVRERYYRKDDKNKPIEDWNGVCQRIINHVCSKESKQFQTEMHRRIYLTHFLPNSPCIVNAGTNIGGLMACFVSKPPEDSWVGMMENLANFGHVARRGGGCGVDFSEIRPEGDPVFGSTHAKACGPIQHMRVVSEAMSSITQAGFRGMANMGVLRVDHPDILKFITCKQRSNALKSLLKEDIFKHFEQMDGHTSSEVNVILDKFLSNFNISILVTDDFMKKVEKDKDIDLVFGGKVYETIPARKIWDLITENAWKNGDPGLLFYDVINNGPYKYSNQKITATNPCVVKGSLVATENGWIPVEDVQEGDLIWSRNSLYPVKTKEVSHNCEVFRVEFTDGDYIDVTAAHQFKCVVSKKYEYRRLDELCEGSKVLVESIPLDKLPTHSITDNIPLSDLDLLSTKYGIEYSLFSDMIDRNDSVSSRRDLGIIIGTVIGDGCFTEGVNRYNVKVAFGHQEQEWQSTFQALLNKYTIKNSLEKGDSSNRVTSNVLGHLLETFGIKRNKAPDKTIPEAIMQSNDVDLLSGILDGLFSTDGNMYLKEDNPMLRLTSSSLELCRQVRRILLGFGIHAKIYKTDRKSHIYHDPQYGDREISNKNPKYDVVIMNQGISRFYQSISLTNPYKEEKIKKCVETYHYLGPLWTSSIRSITPLEGKYTVYDLYNEETDEWNVNGYVQRGCGEQPLPAYVSCNLGSIDVAKFFNEETQDINWDDLKDMIHLGIQFLDDVLSINKFPTEDFDRLAKENRPVGLGIMGWADLLLKMKIAYGSPESLKLASQVAKFLEAEAHKASVELGKKRGTPKACKFDELEHRRNVTLTSIAPTGSISLIAGCSSSIEPIFAPKITRRDNTGEYQMDHPDADKPYFRCAVGGSKQNVITWEEHVDMQAAFQEYGSSGISKTINMENSATVDDVRNAYMRAWKSKCKGITIYRDGCKTTQVLSADNYAGVVGYNNAVRRPKEIPCDIYKTTAVGYDWHIIVGLVNGNPYEVFAVNGKVDLPAGGMVVKKKSRHYALLSHEGEVLIENLAEAEEKIDPKIELETRRFSLELRHQIHPKYICGQIEKTSDVVTSFSKAINRIFKSKYISAGEISADVMCQKCAKLGKKIAMRPESACWRCPECNNTVCG